MMRNAISILVCLLLAGGSALAASMASDSAASTTYNGGWTNGSTGGYGFGAWTISTPNSPSGSGTFIGSSTNNGSYPSGGIDVSGESWGLYANSANLAQAYRSFQGGNLSSGQTLRLSVDNGWIATSSTVGFSLWNASNENLFEFYFVGDNPGGDYAINRYGGEQETGYGWTDDGLNLEFTLTGPTSYFFSVVAAGGGTPSTFTGNLLAPAGGQGVAQVRFFNYNAGSGQNYDTFYNSMSVVPEPTTLALIGLTLGSLYLFLRRRQRR